MKKNLASFLRKLLPSSPLIFLSLACFCQTQYETKYRVLSDSLATEYGIPAAVILGVAILESSRGDSRTCKLLNNHFGVIGKNDLLRSKKIRSRYKQYASSHASYVDFCKIISRKRFYKKLKGNNDCALWVDAISKAGYSEVPLLWKSRVSALIKKNKLS